MAEQTWKIYKLTNKINGKIYIGQTSRDKPEYRWRKGNGYKNNKILYDDIQKYGWENFSHEVIEEVFDKDDARDEELRYIILYNTVRTGYNLSYNTNSPSGGRPSRGVFVFDANKKLINRSKDVYTCAEIYGLSHTTIYNAAKNHYNIFNIKNNNQILYVCFEDEDYNNIEFTFIEKNRKKKSKTLKVLDECLNVVQEFDSPSECATHYELGKDTVVYSIENKIPLKNKEGKVLFACYNSENLTQVKKEIRKKYFSSKKPNSYMFRSQRLYCFQLDKFYNTKKEVADDLGVEPAYVRHAFMKEKDCYCIKGFNVCYEGKIKDIDLDNIENTSKKRKIICNETKEVFNSITECANHFNVGTGVISNICNHKKGYKTIKGQYTFDYLDNREYISKQRNRKIMCIQTRKIFNTVQDASEYYEITAGCIYQNLSNYQKLIKGLSFKYIE